jgi:hypothetical protein
MNIILEGNINFYEQLNNFDSDDEEENVCLLTNLPLDENKITLPCNHSFNFFPLYKEVVNQKTGSFVGLEINRLHFNQIKCPYCRQKVNHLLPHIRLNDQMKYINGVNMPEKICMEFKECSYIFKAGKNKGNYCSKTAFHSPNGCYCNIHQKIASNKKQKTDSICLCKATLKSGKRKGEACGLKIKGEGDYCKRHSSSHSSSI